MHKMHAKQQAQIIELFPFIIGNKTKTLVWLHTKKKKSINPKVISINMHFTKETLLFMTSHKKGGSFWFIEQSFKKTT